MGQRQSSQTPNDSSNENERTSNRQRSTRPPSRNQATLDASRSQVLPTANQRRDERRLRRERQREEQEQLNTSTTFTPTATPPVSPFSRMIASVISEAVLTSFRNGQMASLAASEQQTNVTQQLTMHISPDLFQQMEPGSAEDSFMRFMRLPVVITSVSNRPTRETSTTTTTTTTTTAETAAAAAATTTSTEAATTSREASSTATTLEDVTMAEEEAAEGGEEQSQTPAETEVTRIIMLPVFLYGVRSFHNNNNNNNNNTTTTTTGEEENGSEEDRLLSNIRRSERIRAMAEATTPEEGNSPTATEEEGERTGRVGNGQWTVYIISGNSADGIANDSPSYEELLDLASLIGPARLPTVSQEAIDNHVPIVKYTQQVKQTIIGNSEGCQVCLNSYQSQDDVRVLACHHGFHQECIDKWLTIGKNQCPLCRDVPIPTTSSSSL
ncbi:hypothetical protein BD770DRAFT_226126 [Pilaira anomala]|nr:hypothetical protein BD770DRAFT_226126 [Pilaira anomala]